MHQPTNFEYGTYRVCQLNKSLYGLKQASRVWNMRLNAVLLKYGLKKSHADECIYYQVDGDKILIVSIYVDDILIFCNDVKLKKNFEIMFSKSF